MNIDILAIRKEAIDYAKAAMDFETKEQWGDAFNSYVKAIEKLNILKNNDENKYNKETYHKKGMEYFEKANSIKIKYLTGGQTGTSSGSINSTNIVTSKPQEKENMNSTTINAKRPITPTKPKDKDVKDPNAKDKEKDKPLDEESKKLQDALSSCLVTEKPNVSWDDVAGLEKAKEALKEAVILPLKFKHLFNEKRRPWKGILLYGPPGTGKSYIAKACATEVNGTFFSVSASNIMSKWVGEAERTVRALFELARQSKPAVIFLDEIDSLLSARGEGEQESTRRVKTEFLVQMQGVGHDDTGILVLGATNIPWDLDPAVRRRFQKKIYICLPEYEARYAMLKLNLGKTPNKLTEEDFEDLSEMTDGYSGSDLATLTQEAIYEPLRKCQSATHFKMVDGKYYISSEKEPGAMKIQMFEISRPELLVPPLVERADFFNAIYKIRKTVTLADLEKQDKFTEDFGQEG